MKRGSTPPFFIGNGHKDDREILPIAKEWQNRRLEPMYPIIYLGTAGTHMQ
jgi:hypothetical protein